MLRSVIRSGMVRSFSTSVSRAAVAAPPPPPGSSKLDPEPQTSFKDPFPLPLSHPIQDDSDFPQLEPIDRSNETDIEVTKKRLIYQVRKRGMLEGDLLLATFARDYLPDMTEEEVHEFDSLLDEPDWDIYYWSTFKKPAPERWANSPILEKLRKHTKNEGRVVRKMPALGDAPDIAPPRKE